jgi:acyl-CoA thioesterase I
MVFRLLLLIAALCGGPVLAAPPVILVVGDSLSAAHGIAPEQGWVALLRERLRERGYPHQVVNASVSGDTTAGGLARLPAALDRHRPAFVILELGGNDGLRGLPLEQVRANLAAMIEHSRQSGARVLLAGMRIPPNYGPAYAEGFHRIYVDLGRRYDTALVPFLLDGVAADPSLMQPDGIHPTAEAQLQMLDNVWPHLKPMLQQEQSS